MTCGDCLRLVTFLLVLVFGARPVVADVMTCLNETGYAFQDGQTAARLDSGVVYSFPSSYSSCDPPVEGMVNIGSDPAGAVLMQYRIGFGSEVSTAALASPDVFGVTQGYVNFGQYFSFTVVPDDPNSVGPIPITITARHAFGGIATSVNGSALASNGFVTRFALWTHFVGGGFLVPNWDSEGIIAEQNESFDVIQDVDAPADIKLFLLASVEQSSSAAGGSGANAGAGSAQFASTVTYEVSTEADASIIFDLESLLEFPPPSLDTVIVPEPDQWLMQFSALVAIGSVGLVRRWARN